MTKPQESPDHEGTSLSSVFENTTGTVNNTRTVTQERGARALNIEEDVSRRPRPENEDKILADVVAELQWGSERIRHWRKITPRVKRTEDK